MKWFVSCLIGLFFGFSIMLGILTSYIYIVVDDYIAEKNRASLLAHYNITEE